MKKLFVIVFILFGTLNLIAQEGPSGPAYAVTWQNSSGYWFAVGPTQALWAGERSQEKALEYVIGSKAKRYGEVTKIQTCGKFTVYSLGVDYESYDTDAIKYAQKKGYDCNVSGGGESYVKKDFDHGRYQGYFLNGERHGEGVFNYNDGDKYEGNWKNGQLHGYGIYTFNDGSHYVGQFENNNFHGHGTYTWLESGNKYVGEWKDDQRYNGFMYNKEGLKIAQYTNGTKKELN
ncbi:hypothetical protein [Roseivirga pacifica]|uniref:hypothetical protein n=1 Tax=Roseivirga pacifica TaxID=1267423 RepID=UPI003BB038C5